MGFKGVRLRTKGNDFALLGCGPYFIEYNTLQPMFPSKPFDCSGGLAAFRFFLNSVIDIGYKYTTSSWHLNGFPNGSNHGSTV